MRALDRRPVAELAPAVCSFVSCVSFASFLIGCGGSPSSPSNGETITGSERMGWDQPAADAGELATFRYAIYVDDARNEAADVSCAPAQGGSFTCTSQLPSMAAGSHTLQVAAFVLDGGVVRESSRSASVRVVKR